MRVLGEEPGLGLPNQHTKACPRFQTMHCWCPPATGPGQPHEKDCVHYKRPVPKPESKPESESVSIKFGPGGWSHPALQATVGSYHEWELDDWVLAKQAESIDFIAEAQAYNHAYQWMVKHEVKPLAAAFMKPLVAALKPPSVKCDGCNCDHRFGAIPHAGDCPACPASQSVKCTCAAESGVIGHAASCPLAWKSVVKVTE